MAGQLGSYKIAISPDLASFKEVSRTVGTSLRGAQQQIEKSLSFTGVIQSAASTASAIGSSLSNAGGIAAKGMSVIGGALHSVGSIASSVATAVGDAFVSAGKTASAGLLAGVGALTTQIPAAAKTSDILQGYGTALSAAGFDQSTIDSTRKQLREFADETEYDLNDVMNVSATLAANGVQDFTDLSKALGGFVSTFNLEDPAQGYKQLAFVTSQIAGAGRVMTGDFYQVQNAVPAAADKLKQALANMGAYVGDFKTALSTGQISSEEFFSAIKQLGLTDEAQAAATSVDTFSGAIGNMQAAIQASWLDILEKYKPALTKFISGPLTKAAQDTIKLLGSVADKIASVLLDSQGEIRSFNDIVSTVFSSLDINAMLSRVVSMFSTVSQTIVAGLETIVPKLTSALNQLDFSKLFDVADELWKGILDIDWSGLFNAMVGAAKRAIDALPSLFSISVDKIQMPTGDQIAAKLVDAIKGALDLGSMLLGKLADGFDYVAAHMSEIMSVVGTALGALLNGIADWFLNTDSNGQTGASKLFDAVSKMIYSMMANLDKIGEPIGELIGRALGGINLKDIISNVFKALGAIIQGLFSFLTGLIKGVIAGFREQISTGGTEAVRGSATAILGAMSPGFAPILTWANDKANELVKQFSSKASAMKDAGRQLMNGLEEGVTEKYKMTTSKGLQAVGNSITRDYYKLWKIHSPSRVFAEIGGYLMSGLQRGIENGATGVYSVASSFAGQLEDALTVQPEVAFSTANTQQQLQRLAQERMSSLESTYQQSPLTTRRVAPTQITINQQITKMDDLSSIYSMTKRAANGYFARALA